jgi:hypothetical protein
MLNNTKNTQQACTKKKSQAHNKEATHNKKVIKLCLNKELINCHQRQKKLAHKSLNSLLAKNPF